MSDPTSSSASSSSPRAPIPSSSRFTPTSGKILRVLTATQNTSALVFSVFLGVHLVSPLAAAFGGMNVADKAMLLGREYYLPLEPLLVYTPILVHLSTSLLKRSYLLYLTRKPPPSSTHLITGYILPFFLIPHIYIHRIFPSSPSPPISNLSPSELGWEFVGWSCWRWPVWSIIGYGGVVGVGCWHAGVGLMKVVNWLRPRRKVEEVQNGEKPRTVVGRGRKLGLRGLLLGLLGVMGIGLVRVSREGKWVSSVMARRYEAVYARLPLYSLIR